MNSLTRKTFLMTLIPAAMTTVLVQACGGSGDADAQAAASDPVEGAWESAVTIRDCATGSPVRTFKGLGALHRGGTASATNNQPPAALGPAFGTWVRGASGPTYTVTLRAYRFNPDGSSAGAQRVVRTVTLAADGATLTGTIAAQVLDNNDAVLQSICGTETARRVS